MAFGIGDLLQTMQQGVVGINALTAQIKATFTTVTTTSTTAPSSVGSVTFTSSEAVMFQVVTTSSGYIGKMPIYPL